MPLLTEHADVPGLPQPEFPVRSERGMHDVAALRRAPGLGEHSRAVLSELGYDMARIDQMTRDAVTRLGGPPRLQD